MLRTYSWILGVRDWYLRMLSWYVFHLASHYESESRRLTVRASMLALVLE